MNEKNLFERQKRAALTFNVFMKASFVPARLIVNKMPAVSSWRAADGAPQKIRLDTQ
jgi:hypothetical protein